MAIPSTYIFFDHCESFRGSSAYPFALGLENVLQAQIFRRLNEGIHAMLHGQKSEVQSKVRRLFLRQHLLYVVGYDFDSTRGIWHWSTAQELLCQGAESNEDQGQQGWMGISLFTLPLQHLPMLKYQDVLEPAKIMLKGL